MIAPQSQKQSRSRAGCTECRKRHRKCDEQKPSCASCVRAGKHCEYAVRLSWGGRPFGKSRFGQCLQRDPGLVRVPVKANNEGRRAFVYGSAKGAEHPELAVSQQQANNQMEGSNQTSTMTTTTMTNLATNNETEMDSQEYEQDNHLDEMIAITYTNHLIRNPYELSWLSSAKRLLLNHFMSCTTLSLSCHPIIQNDFCTVLVPMALETPHLLTALLAFAAKHRIALGLPQSEPQLDFLKCVSLRQLQEALAPHSSRELSDAVVATTLTLCTTDIICGTRTPGSWRSHLQGTAAIISDTLQHILDSPEELSPAESLLWRWYLSIETLSFLCGNLAISPPPSSRTALQMRRIIKNNEIDDLAGFSASLIPVFSDINLLAVESIKQQRQQQQDAQQKPQYSDQSSFLVPQDDILSALEADASQTPYLPDDHIRSRCYRLITHVRSMLASHEPRFRPLVDASLSSLHRIDFVALDETYHHVALLHLYRRVLNLPSSSPLVRDSVEEIMSRLSTMHFLREPCPGVAVLQPVFTAGCEARNAAERDNVRSVLARIETRYGMGNVQSVLLFLEKFWVTRDERGDTEGRMRWDEVMVAMGLDILPY